MTVLQFIGSMTASLLLVTVIYSVSLWYFRIMVIQRRIKNTTPINSIRKLLDNGHTIVIGRNSYIEYWASIVPETKEDVKTTPTAIDSDPILASAKLSDKFYKCGEFYEPKK